jgi:hypothetical protein
VRTKCLRVGAACWDSRPFGRLRAGPRPSAERGSAFAIRYFPRKPTALLRSTHRIGVSRGGSVLARKSTYASDANSLLLQFFTTTAERKPYPRDIARYILSRDGNRSRAVDRTTSFTAMQSSSVVATKDFDPSEARPRSLNNYVIREYVIREK